MDSLRYSFWGMSLFHLNLWKVALLGAGILVDTFWAFSVSFHCPLALFLVTNQLLTYWGSLLSDDSFFFFCFRRFPLSFMDLFVFILLGVCRISTFKFFIRFGKFAYIFLHVFFSASFSSSFGVSIMHMLGHQMVFQGCLRLFFFILLCFSDHIYQSIDSLSLLPVQIYCWAHLVNFSFQLLRFPAPRFVLVVFFFLIICLFTDTLYLMRPCDYAFLFFLPPPQSCYYICLSVCLVKLFFKSLPEWNLC